MNNGYSTICTFTYGSLAASLAEGIELELQTNGTGVRQGYANWNANGVFTNYVLEVRKTGNEDFEWFPYTTELGIPTADMKINSLEPETEYEARIKGLIGNDYESEYSNISVFTTNPPPNYACGTTTMPAKTPNIVPLMNAIVGQTFTVGQFDMRVTSIESLNQAGHFKGTGKITMPFIMMQLNVSFQDILVDDNLTIREGKVEAITKGIDAWEHDLLIDMATPHYVPAMDTTMIQYDSTGVTVNFEGVDSVFTFEGGGVPIVLNAAGGLQYIIWPDGTIELGTWNVSDDSLDATEDYFVYFEKAPAPDQTYGFDAYNDNNTAWEGNYENILLKDGTPYYVSFKSTAKNDGDFVIAKFETDSTVSDLIFIIEGEEISGDNITVIDDKTYKIDLNGYMQDHSKDLYAYDGNSRKIGKLHIITYAEKIIDLVIVPVGNATIDLPLLQDSLNAIYACANTSFNVTVAPTYNDLSWDIIDDGAMQIDDPELFDLYSDEMKALRHNYFETNDRNNQALYLFVINEFSSPGTEGYMVHNKSLGFLKSNPSVRTIAHEIGHGAFDLPHTFPEVTEGSSDNLMDYVSNNNIDYNTHLTKVQWEQIFTNVLSFSFLDDAEDGESATTYDLAVLNRFENDGFLTFLTPSSKIISLPLNTTSISFGLGSDDWTNYTESENDDLNFPYGPLLGFTFNNTYYQATIKAGTNQFLGYTNNELLLYKDIYSYHIENIEYILGGIPCISSNEIVFKIMPILPGLIDLSIDTINFGDGIIDSDPTCFAYKFTNGNNAELIYADFSTDFSESELTFLNEFGGRNVCGRASIYAFETAYLLRKNPKYLNCMGSLKEDSNFDLDKEAWKWYQTAIQSSSEYGTESPLLGFDSNGNFQSVTDLYLSSGGFTSYYAFSNYNGTSDDFYEYYYLNLLNYIETISKEAPNLPAPNTDPDFGAVANHLIDNIDDNQRKCMIYQIPWLQRKSMLEECAEWTLGDQKEELIAELIENCPLDQQSLLLSELKKNNFSLLGVIFGDTWSEENARIVFTISHYILNEKGLDPNSSFVEYTELKFSNPDTPSDSPYQHFYLAKNSTKTSQGFSYWTNSKFSYGKIFIDQLINQEGELQKHINYPALNPYDMVIMRVGDNFQFANINGDANGHQTYLVPAIFVHWSILSQQSIENMAAFRIFLNLAAAVITVSTGQPTAFIAVELIINTIDIVVALNEDNIITNGTPEQKALLKTYDEISNLCMLAGVGYIITKTPNNITKITKYIFNRSKLKNGIKELKKSKPQYLEIINNFESLIKNTKVKFFTKGSDIFQEKLLNLFYEFKLNLNGSKIDFESIVLGQNKQLAISNGLHDVSFGTYIINNDEIVLSITKWRNNTDGVSKILTSLENVNYIKPNGQAKIGNLEVILTTQNKVQVIETTRSMSKLEDLSLLDNFAQSSLSSIDPLKHRQIYFSLLDELPKNVFDEALSISDDLSKAKFLTDYTNTPVFKNAIDANPKLIDAWEVLDDAGVDDVLRRNIDELELVSTHYDDILNYPGGYNAWKLANAGGSFAKLSTKSSLSTSLFNSLDNALASAPSIKFNYGTKTLQSPKQFLNATGNDMYDIVLSNGAYAKFDKTTGRMLYSDGTNQFFVRYTTGNNVANVEQLINSRVTQLRNCLGLNGNQTIQLTNGLGSATTSPNKTLTFIGKTDETQLLKNQFGDFKHIEVGETAGGVNLLNMPDPYFNGATWFVEHNKGWMLRGINRGDDFYIASPINQQNLINQTNTGIEYGSYYANELNELVQAGIKPKNISQTAWNQLIPDITDAASKKLNP